MLTYFHPLQLKHHPRTYLSRGQMRTPQEIPERALRLVEASKALGFDVREPADFGVAPLAAVHGMNYLRFLEEANREWKKVPVEWGDEMMSNVYIRENNPLRGVLGQAARYLADSSCPVDPDTYESAYWSAQSALAEANAILDGARETYALCRPLGHHARAEAADGFLLPEQRGNRGASAACEEGREPSPTCTTARTCRKSSTTAATCCMSPFTATRRTSILSLLASTTSVKT